MFLSPLQSGHRKDGGNSGRSGGGCCDSSSSGCSDGTGCTSGSGGSVDYGVIMAVVLVVHHVVVVVTGWQWYCWSLYDGGWHYQCDGSGRDCGVGRKCWS